MANHKKQAFNMDDQQMSLIAKAMSHPARITIIRILAEHPLSTCGQIVDLLPLAQATVSHHLKELQAAQLITMVADGKKSLYEINWVTWNAYTTEFSVLLSMLNKGV
jgi:ArsR family transcriptional regulator